MRASATRQMCSHESLGSNWYTNSSPTASRLSREFAVEHLSLSALCHSGSSGAT